MVTGIWLQKIGFDTAENGPAKVWATQRIAGIPKRNHGVHCENATSPHCALTASRCATRRPATRCSQRAAARSALVERFDI